MPGERLPQVSGGRTEHSEALNDISGFTYLLKRRSDELAPSLIFQPGDCGPLHDEGIGSEEILWASGIADLSSQCAWACPNRCSLSCRDPHASEVRHVRRSGHRCSPHSKNANGRDPT